VFACTSLLGCCWLASPAQGALVFKSSGQIAGPAPGEHFGTLDPESVAVNDSNGHILVADSSKGVVYDFSSLADTTAEVWEGTTTPAKSFGHGRVSVAVDQSTGDVYVSDATDMVVDKFDATGKLITSFGDSTPTPDGQLAGAAAPTGAFVHPGTETPIGIAVDQTTHDLYVIDSGHEVVDEFDSTGAYLSQITGTGETIEGGFGLFGCGGEYTDGIAVNSTSGHVLVSDSCPVKAFEFEAGGAFLKVLDGSNTPARSFGALYTSVAVDDTSGLIYVTDGADGVTDAFSEAGEYEGQILGVPTATKPRGAVATDPANGTIYVSDNGTGSVSVFPVPIVVPDVTTAEAGEVSPEQATLKGSVNPLGEGNAQCQFIWGEKATLDKTVPCSAAVPDGTSAVEVHEVLGGLQRDTEYCFRLQASNKNGTNPGDASQNECFRTAGPGLRGEWASEVTSESASLNARIDPNGSPTSYYFQYGPSAAYGSTVPAAPGQAIGAEPGEREVAPQHIQGLSSSSEYHYRVVVLSETSPGHTEEVTGPDLTFVTQAASTEAGLPDGRQWEQVTPLQKHGALVNPISEEGVIESAPNGQAFTYQVNATTEAEAQGNAQSPQVLSRRTASGWASQDIAIPQETATGATTGSGVEYPFFSPDLTSAVLQPAGAFPAPGSVFSLSAKASEQTPYVRTNLNDGNLESPCEPTAEACYRPIVTGGPGVANVPAETVFGEHGGPRFHGATDDLSHVILTSSVALTKTPISEGEGLTGGLYEWSADAPPSEQLKLVSVLPGPGGEAASGGLYLGGGGDAAGSARGAIGPGGQRVFWEASTAGGEASLYVRDIADEKTLQLDAVQGGSGEGSEKPQFQIANATADRVLFTDRQRLRPGSGGADLYECKLIEGPGGLSCELEDLTPLGPAGEEAEVQGVVLGTSEDGSVVYFVAKGALSGSEANEHDEVAAHGQPNLYMREGGQTKLVAVLAEGDSGDWGYHSGLSGLTARVSPSGRFLAFTSQRSLTGYDNRDAHSNQPDEEVYEFDKQTGRLVCASCNPTGGRPEGVEVGGKPRRANVGGTQSATWIAGSIPGWTPYQLSHALYQSRYLSNEGRLFFNSQDSLVPQDTNGTEDVYEYEPEAVGSCKRADTTFSSLAGGCVSLLSGGVSNEESAFLDASENGDDVFFMTAAALGKSDGDTQLDVYDAHVCSSEAPCLPEAPQRLLPCATGDACKPAPTPQPAVFGAPPSALFSGIGNVTPPAAVAVKAKAKPPTRAQKLARALKACKKDKNKHKRATCEKTAHKSYGRRK
jgi:hypothetical protein